MYSLAYWFFHVITLEQKVFSQIHELKSEKILKENRRCLNWSVKTHNIAARVVTDRHTDTQNNYCNPRGKEHTCSVFGAHQ